MKLEAQTRAVNWQIWFALNVGKYVSFLTSNYLLPKREMRRNLEVSKYFIQHYVIIFYFPAITVCLSFWPRILDCTRIARIKLGTWNLIQKREIKGIIENYTLEYHVLESFWCNLFWKKDILIKQVCNFKAKAKIICLDFFSNFVFSKLKGTNMAHNDLLFVWLVFGTQLSSKNVKESHMVPKKIIGTELSKLLTIRLICKTIYKSQTQHWHIYVFII